ncbi:hypothetical protein C3L33_14522, partial [Rhododendron williamsianum]
MATAVGFVSGGAYGSSWIRSKNKAVRGSDMVCRVSCVSSSTTTRDPYKTLMVKPGASKSEYHPDVCRGGHSSVQFQRINEAYDMVMSNLRGELTRPEMKMYEPSDAGTYERKRGTYDWNGSMDDPFWDESDMWLGVGM